MVPLKYFFEIILKSTVSEFKADNDDFNITTKEQGGPPPGSHVFIYGSLEVSFCKHFLTYQ